MGNGRRRVDVAGVLEQEANGNTSYFINLVDDGGSLVRVYAGHNEAVGVHHALSGAALERPMTSGLLIASLGAFGVEVVDAAIVDIRDGAFCAELTLRQGGVEKNVDARTTDAIEVALRAGRPIYIADIVYAKLDGGD